VAEPDPFEVLYARGVTDGLPVVPPTPARVRAAVAASGREAGELVALVPPNSAVIPCWTFPKSSRMVMRKIHLA
jgi:hypothetical protein